MYAEFFGLRELPFNNTPDPRYFYSTPDHEEALASLIYAVKQRKGFVLLTGEVGAGKTLVTRLMLRNFGTSIAFANINHAIRDGNDLMESVCTEFELPVQEGMTHSHLVRMLHDYLLSQFAANIPVVLVLDEAQNLPVAAFEELRMIGNLEADSAKLLQIAIVGQPELQKTFATSELRQLKQRLFRSFHLGTLDRRQTEGYIRYRLSVAAASDTGIFTTEAVDLIHEQSHGLPRIINTICDNAMLSAYSSDLHVIDEDLVESVLPRPVTTSANLGGVEPRHAILPPVAVERVKPVAPPAFIPSSRIQAQRESSGAPLNLEANPAFQALAEQLQGVARTVDRLDANQRTVKGNMAQAELAKAELQALLHRGDAMLDRGEKLATQIEQREIRGHGLLESLRVVGQSLKPTLAKLADAVSIAKKQVSDAEVIHKRLLEQNDRSLAVARSIGRLTSRVQGPTERDVPVAKTVVEVSAGTSVILSGGSLDPRTIDAGRFEKILAETQASLGDLRLMARGRNTANASKVEEVPRLVEATPEN